MQLTHTGEVDLMSISLDLLSLVLGVVLGINLFLLYDRFFRSASKRERMLTGRIKELERRLSEKDRLIRKAVKTVVDEHRSSQEELATDKP